MRTSVTPASARVARNACLWRSEDVRPVGHLLTLPKRRGVDGIDEPEVEDDAVQLRSLEGVKDLALEPPHDP